MRKRVRMEGREEKGKSREGGRVGGKGENVGEIEEENEGRRPVKGKA